MVTIILLTLLAGLICWGILVVVRVLDHLFDRLINWVRQKIRERQGKVFAGKLSRIIQSAMENGQEIPTLDLSKLPDPEQTIVTAATNQDGKIANSNDIQVLNIASLDLNDVRDAAIITALDNEALTILT